MNEVMVTFQAGNRKVDLRLPGSVAVGELIAMLGEALGFRASREYRLQAEPLGRILDSGKTLLEEEVTQGSLLTLIE